MTQTIMAAPAVVPGGRPLPAGEERRSGRADPDTDEQEGRKGERQAECEIRLEDHHREGRERARCGEQGDAADDPRVRLPPRSEP